MKRKMIKGAVLFLVGYCAYIAIEVTYRNVSYPIMGVCGGLAILLLDKINDNISWDMDITIQCACGAALISLFELVIGEIALRTELLPVMWDYSNVALNFDGVVCLPFSTVWALLSVAAIMLADAINYYVFDEDTVPYYKLFGRVVFKFGGK